MNKELGGKGLRRFKSEARRGIGNYDTDQGSALNALDIIYYHGDHQNSDRELLEEYWQISHEYKTSNNWDEFKERLGGFFEGLDKSRRKSKQFNAAISLIRVWFG